MNRICCLSILFFLASISYCQEEFSFELYFEDAQGNEDTVKVGYDENATDGIDVFLGEQDIISQPRDSVLDVRLSEQLSDQNGLAPMPPPTIHTKKQIVEKSCNRIFDFEMTLNVVGKYYPIEVSWDSTLFISTLDSCHAGTLFSTYDYYQNDVGTQFAFFANQNSIMLYDNTGFPFYYDDTLKVNLYWVSFSKEQTVSVGEEIDPMINEYFTLYPNPSDEKVILHIPSFEESHYNVSFYNSVGRTINITLVPTATGFEINTSGIESGIYQVLLRHRNGVVSTKKLVIQHWGTHSFNSIRE